MNSIATPATATAMITDISPTATEAVSGPFSTGF